MRGFCDVIGCLDRFYTLNSALPNVAAADTPLLPRSSAGNPGVTCTEPPGCRSTLLFFRFVLIVEVRNTEAPRAYVKCRCGHSKESTGKNDRNRIKARSQKLVPGSLSYRTVRSPSCAIQYSWPLSDK